MPKLLEPLPRSRSGEGWTRIPWTLTPQSSWVHSYRYNPARLMLQMKFKNRRGRITVSVVYPNVTRTTALYLNRAKSKGKFVWRHLYYRPYIKGGPQ